ncbi:hypothetical protein OH773_21910 (plasmid) [Buttiauxella sp. WJP83]|uniref:hypothetical protein n=1 Tax=Buttiauxella sp. WJP83 TaxID=2986951 RepID=UPI0022DE4148|nr:hypothetical protein [Buttiauxella sp. WJP83]WBM73020.1 hypothetical protein OH773_21910 [Buttiauxella sp. WJP83]
MKRLLSAMTILLLTQVSMSSFAVDLTPKPTPTPTITPDRTPLPPPPPRPIPNVLCNDGNGCPGRLSVNASDTDSDTYNEVDKLLKNGDFFKEKGSGYDVQKRDPGGWGGGGTGDGGG